MARRRRPAGSGRRGYQRTERVNHLLQEVVAEELERIDRDDLGFVTITGVVVDSELRQAKVFLHRLDDDTAEILAELRPRLQRAIADQARLRRTPELVFLPDPAIAAGERVEEILHGLDEGTER